MCKMNFMPIDESICPCGKCEVYLLACKPMVIDGFIYGECDECYCPYCNQECQERSF